MGLETKITENEIELIDDDPVIIDEEKQPVEIDSVDQNQQGINKKDQQVDANQQGGIIEKDQQVEIVDSPIVELIQDDVNLVENNGKNNEISKDSDNGTIDNGKNNAIEPIEIVDEPTDISKHNEVEINNAGKNNENELIEIGDEPMEINDNNSSKNSENEHIEILDESVENVTIDFIGKFF